MWSLLFSHPNPIPYPSLPPFSYFKNEEEEVDLDLDVALALFPTTASGRLAAEAVVVAVSGGIAGAVGEVVQHCVQVTIREE